MRTRTGRANGSLRPRRQIVNGHHGRAGMQDGHGEIGPMEHLRAGFADVLAHANQPPSSRQRAAFLRTKMEIARRVRNRPDRPVGQEPPRVAAETGCQSAAEFAHVAGDTANGLDKRCGIQCADHPSIIVRLAATLNLGTSGRLEMIESSSERQVRSHEY